MEAQHWKLIYRLAADGMTAEQKKFMNEITRKEPKSTSIRISSLEQKSVKEARDYVIEFLDNIEIKSKSIYIHPEEFTATIKFWNPKDANVARKEFASHNYEVNFQK